MKVKRRILMDVWRMINRQRGQIHGIKFSYFLAKNRRRLQPEIEALEEIIKTPLKYQEYDTERAKTARSFADTDSEGNPIINQSNYVITEKLTEFNEALNKLKEKYKEHIDARQRQIKEYDEMLEEEIEFDGYKITLSELPEKIDAESIEILMDSGLLAE